MSLIPIPRTLIFPDPLSAPYTRHTYLVLSLSLFPTIDIFSLSSRVQLVCFSIPLLVCVTASPLFLALLTPFKSLVPQLRPIVPCPLSFYDRVGLLHVSGLGCGHFGEKIPKRFVCIQESYEKKIL